MSRKSLSVLIASGIVVVIVLIYLLRSPETEVDGAAPTEKTASSKQPDEAPATAIIEDLPGAFPSTSWTRKLHSSSDHRLARPPQSKLRVLTDAIALSRQLHSPQLPPTGDVEKLGEILRIFRLYEKENPVGLNEEIIEQLAGDNASNIVVFPPDHPDIGLTGELLDRWGTPYAFHSLTDQDMDIHSAGPDQQWSTDDDLSLGLNDQFGDSLGLRE